MELLTWLSPNPIDLLDLADELDWTEQKVRDCIRQLRDKAFEIVVQKGKVFIPRNEWPRTEVIATAYHERTYQS